MYRKTLVSLSLNKDDFLRELQDQSGNHNQKYERKASYLCNGIVNNDPQSDSISYNRQQYAGFNRHG